MGYISAKFHENPTHLVWEERKKERIIILAKTVVFTIGIW